MTQHRREGTMDMYTTKQAAAVLDLELRTVSTYIRRGVLNAQKYGRDWMLSEKEVKRYQRERKQSGRPKKLQNDMS